MGKGRLWLWAMMMVVCFSCRGSQHEGPADASPGYGGAGGAGTAGATSAAGGVDTGGVGSVGAGVVGTGGVGAGGIGDGGVGMGGASGGGAGGANTAGTSNVGTGGVGTGGVGAGGRDAGGGGTGGSGTASGAGGRDAGGVAGGARDGASPGWTIAFEETFENAKLPAPAWSADTYPDDGFSDNGPFFRGRGVTPPKAYRTSAAFGSEGWLTFESTSRESNTGFTDLLAITADPAGGSNRVLRLASPAHTDATVVRSSAALPERYRISLRVGYASFGDGLPGKNGYSGGETADPWLPDEDATVENGFYWLTILDTVPRPHNNVYIHHHRKVCMDSDNNVPPWTEIFDGKRFIESGEMPVMMFGIDGLGKLSELNGKPFYAFAGNAWQPSGKIRAVDSYRPMTWYRVSIERTGDRFTLEISGDFRYGGVKTYSATIDAAAKCLWHYNRTPLPAGSACIDNTRYPSLPDDPPLWPANTAWPDYFMFGDPHNNFYEGSVYYDDIRLEIWHD